MPTRSSHAAPPPHPGPLFDNLPREHGFEPVVPAEAVPAALRGTLYRNGLGLMDRFGRRYRHLFEADGAVTAYRFSDAGLSVAARVVQSRGLQEEQAAGKHLASLRAAWPHRFLRTLRGASKNTANTHVVARGGELWALMEAGKPTRVDADTLDTLGDTDLGGLIDGTFSAHPHRVARRGCLYNFGFRYGKQTELVLYALPHAGPGRQLCRVPLARPLVVHDFAVTQRHAVFFLGPLTLRVWRILLSLPDFERNLRWSPELGTEVVLVDLDRPERVVRFHTDPFFVFHFAGAFEEGGEIVVDYVRYADGSLLGALGDGSGLSWAEADATPPAILHRARIDPARRRMHTQPRADFRCEFPRVAPSQEGGAFDAIWLQSEVYMEGELRSQLTRVDTSDHAIHLPLERGQLCAEPVPVEVPGQGARYVVAPVYDAYQRTSHLLVADATTLAVQAQLPLPEVVPLTFHGSWVPADDTAEAGVLTARPGAVS